MDWSTVLGDLASGNVLGAVASGVSGVLGAVTGTTGAKGTLVGGTVTRAGGGLIFVKTTSGKEIAIRRKKTHHYHSYRGGRGLKMEKLIELSLMKSMLK
jgi:hypothetical protein